MKKSIEDETLDQVKKEHERRVLEAEKRKEEEVALRMAEDVFRLETVEQNLEGAVILSKRIVQATALENSEIPMVLAGIWQTGATQTHE
ncbi:hypothetical protein IV203_031672 [Nitzschia inconspicua]|uniref:Uncharacterized protein n=1 Tax=Nitzschia inconspicua TaxID=303405 RepID=A0A9K3LUR7_9STRA|nr:hypothetical protein IV203_031672 [Nitzschia inconspicua]